MHASVGCHHSQYHQELLCGSHNRVSIQQHCHLTPPGISPIRSCRTQHDAHALNATPKRIRHGSTAERRKRLLYCKAVASAAPVAPAVQSSVLRHEVDTTVSEAQLQSLEILEWPAVCRQVAAFCGTSMAAELLLAGQLPIGRSQQESELLLQQTQEAADAQLQVTGVFDLRPALAAVTAGGVLNARQLEGIAASMEASYALRATVCAATADAVQQFQHRQQQQFNWPCLADLAAGIQDRELTMLQAVRSCIRDGSILSQASPELAAVRAARQTNKEAARSLVTQIARQLHTQGAAEGKEPLLMRGRYCVAVRTNQRSALSKGSVRLGASGTGATLYMEPFEVLELNNKEALLAEQEEEQEVAVLQALSMLLAQRAPAIQAMLDSVASLDIVAARAKHAAWLDAVQPAFVSPGSNSRVKSATSGTGGSNPIYFPGARHPLLMQSALPRLPRPPSVDDASFESDFIPPPVWALATSSSDSDSDDADNPGDLAGVQGPRPLPKPLDLRVPSAVRVVAITGPNTGGKTVTLKTAGLLAIMAKAGLYVPVDKQELAAAAAEAGASEIGSGSSKAQPRLLWFDQILADIGDAQSLQQNLSTFSGHIRRLKMLLGAAGPNSLVLLDEVGSGTDPQEGAALARAVLDTLASQARLTLATSHHAELKAAAEEDSRYVNVSMEFNTLTLRPTYKLCWGSAGNSNALDIAQALGFDSRVLAEARILARAELGVQEQEKDKGKMKQVAANVEGQIETAKQKLAELVALREKREKQLQQLLKLINDVRVQRNKIRSLDRVVDKEQADMILSIQQAAKAVRKQQKDIAEVQAIIDMYVSKVAGKRSSSSSNSKPAAVVTGQQYLADELRPGDWVYVPEGLEGLISPSMKVQVKKVDEEHVWLDLAPLNLPILRHKATAGSKGHKMPRSKVVREDLVSHLQQQAQQTLEGLEGYSAEQAEKDQQLNHSVDSALGAAGAEAAAIEEHADQQQQPIAEQEAGDSAAAAAALSDDVRSKITRQRQRQQQFDAVQQMPANTLDVDGMVKESAVDELRHAISSHLATAGFAAAAGGDATAVGLQVAGGSGYLEGGVLYVQHGTGAVKEAILGYLGKQQEQGAVVRVQEGTDAATTVVWLAAADASDK